MPLKRFQPRLPRKAATWLKLFWVVTFFWVMVAFGAWGTYSWKVQQVQDRLPAFDELKKVPGEQTIRVHAADGTIIHVEGAIEGKWISYDEIPDDMIKAIIAIEDRRYYDHAGVDIKALARVAYRAWEDRGTDARLQGASTITQQAARLIFLSRNYSIRRKIDEAVTAMAMERIYTKRQILELYLNRTYFGGGAHGIDAASRAFFNHGVDTLSLNEAALLAGLVKAPSNYAPTADEEAALDRSKVVLGVMRQQGKISSQQYQETQTAKVVFDQEDKPARDSTRYFVDWMLPQAKAMIGKDARGIDIYTTLDLGIQDAAEKAVNANAPKGAEAAAVTLGPHGELMAMVGGRDYATSSFNRATQALRQPGSSFKPVVYLAAIEQGWRPASAVLDAPITINGWSPRNDSGRYSGTVSLTQALTWSLNTVSVRLTQDVGQESVMAMARRLGITTPVPNEPSIALGSAEVRLLSLTKAYAVIGAQGRDIQPYAINRIDADGETIYKSDQVLAQEQGRALPIVQLLRQDTAGMMIQMMANVVESGTGTGADLGRSTAGKTGTTSDNKDGWFIGFSSGITTGIWMGRDDAKPVPGLQGGRAPATAFRLTMREAIKERPEYAFPSVPTGNIEPVETDENAEPSSAPVQDRSPSNTQGNQAPAVSEAPATPPRQAPAQAPSQPATGTTPPAAAAPNNSGSQTGRSRAIPLE